MSNFATLDAITDNLESVLKTLGIKFTAETFDDVAAVPASLIPLGQVFFNRIDFEYTFGQKPEYAEAGFNLRVILQDRDPRMLARVEQKWAHGIRDALTINALNIGALAASKLVSRVTSYSINIDHSKPQYGVLNYGVKIRYREV